MSKEIPLAPCPHCGDKAQEWTEGPGYPEQWHMVRCFNIRCMSGTSKWDKMEHAIAAWNRRAPSPRLAALDEVLTIARLMARSDCEGDGCPRRGDSSYPCLHQRMGTAIENYAALDKLEAE